MTGHGEKLTRKQEQAIAVLLIGEKTLRRWLAEPAFTTAYRSARQQLVESALAMLQQSTEAAVQTLERKLRAKKPGDQIRAGLVDSGLEMVEKHGCGRWTEQSRSYACRSGISRTALQIGPGP
jgi:hypothetical protein